MNTLKGETYRHRLLIDFLRSPQAIRASCSNLLPYAQRGELKHFDCNFEHLPTAADFVHDQILRFYPSLDIPYHSRWRHFEAGGFDRLELLRNSTIGSDPKDRLKSAIELVIVSVLLDAGAGTNWQYKDHHSDKILKNSEGLAVASFNLFLQGVFSSDPNNPCQVDPVGLQSLNELNLANALQISDNNPIVSLSGRLGLLHALGDSIKTKSAYFGENKPRLGNLLDYWLGQTKEQTISITTVFSSLLEALTDIWPGRHYLDKVNLGDVWPYQYNITQLNPQGLIPFHKLTQWLCYSLIEPLESIGIEVTDIDVLTGLPEYRNGGLFVDLQVLTPKDKRAFNIKHNLNSEFIVEWRAMTVVLLDLLADGVRHKFGVSKEQMPLAKILQGGTWTAGRIIASQLRKDGGPPFILESDGTIF